MSSAEAATRQPFFRRLDLLYFVLAGVDVLTICTALFLNHIVTTAFEDGVRTSALWSRRQADIIQLSRLAQDVDAPGNDIFYSRNIGHERASFEAALARFNQERARVTNDIERAPLSTRDTELLRRVAAVQETMDRMALESEHIFDEFEDGRVDSASRGMAVMDRTFATLRERLDEALALVDSGRAEHLEAQLASARAMRQLEIIIAAAVLMIVCLVAAYGSHMGRALRTNQEQRAAMLQEVAAARDRLQHYADDVSHELRGPISKLRLDAEVLLAQPRTASEYREGIEAILAECVRVSTIVESLLFLARANNMRAPPNAQLLDADHELQLLVEFYAAAAERAQVTLRLNAQPVQVYADRPLLQRAVSNLVSNALDHTPPGGTITLSASSAHGRALIDVIDTGEGIPAELRPHVFDRFVRGGKKSQGLGLGLAITKSIMELHHGSVSLIDDMRPGTHIRLEFPSPPNAVRAPGENYDHVISAQ